MDTSMPLHFRTQKMPWITDTQGAHREDTQLMMRCLAAQDPAYDIDSELTDAQRAVGRAFRGAIENEWIWIVAYRRYYNDKSWNTCLRLYDMSGLRGMMFAMFGQKMVRKLLWDNGVARYEEVEIFRKGDEIIQAIMTTMGTNKFFFGDKLTSLDLVIYGLIAPEYQLCKYFTWADDSLPAKMPFMKEMNEYMKRVEIECFGALKYWKDIV
eukprot:CAMPEP_0202700572 /NCGR_PEP_ID=MMETSP1385-20130828/13748_1 /ASSEMBLY_ACC=CAM_ASM_000861 /TAXON_ID=933848 /ORGANISM="Elphidium margaritaceum" /LENGTH=210 /DNA_ID=CAMNT_0049357787 /DNA_START=266 /DNA_END=898 /DNA_ORIENTATION=+